MNIPILCVRKPAVYRPSSLTGKPPCISGLSYRRANGIASPAVFGSALRDDFGPDSDVDLLVEFQPGQPPGIHFVTIAKELETLFGRPVDLLIRAAVEQSQNPIHLISA